jgi:hypothetical protein
MPTARRTVRRRRNPSSFVGERIREAIQFMRAEAHDLRKKADDIEDAWGQHDYAYLRDVGVITQSQYADIMAEAAAHAPKGSISQRALDTASFLAGRANPRRRRTVARRRR